jgi:hypothetical protein
LALQVVFLLVNLEHLLLLQNLMVLWHLGLLYVLYYL